MTEEENMPKCSKYDSALALYDTRLDNATVQARAESLVADKMAENNTEKVKRLLFHCLDLTTLEAADNDKSVMEFVEKVNRFDDARPDWEPVASVCVYTNFAEIAKNTLEVDGVAISCVAGGFPSGQTFGEVKVAETALALADGADEIDTVMPVGRFLAGDYETLCDELQELKETCKSHPLKVILETGLLKHASDIKKAAILAMYSGADFLKTSTGKVQPGATPAAAYVMCEAIREYHEKTGRKVGFKAAGGIRTVADALAYYTIVKEVLGTEWLTPDYFRIGASRLANALLSDVEGKETVFF